MKRVSFNIAKAIKEAGYPQECDMYYLVPPKYQYIGLKVAQPSYFEVCLWLWREKKCNVMPIPTSPFDGFWSSEGGKYDDPEEAIIAAIDTALEDLTDNKI